MAFIISLQSFILISLFRVQRFKAKRKIIFCNGNSEAIYGLNTSIVLFCKFLTRNKAVLFAAPQTTIKPNLGL